MGNADIASLQESILKDYYSDNANGYIVNRRYAIR